MADNTELPAGSGGDTVATDDIGGVKFQRVKLIEGADGTNDGDIAAGNPLPVEIIDVDGTSAADLAAIKTALEIIDNVVSGSEAQVDVVTQDGVAAEGGALGNGILLQGDDGTDRKNVAVDATSGNLKVDVVSALPAGTAAIGKLAANSGVDIGDVDVLSLPGVAGDVAHDAANSGNPLQLGGHAVDFGANPTEVAADDRTRWLFNRAGIPFVLGGHPNIITHRANYSADQTNVAIVTVGANVAIVVTYCAVLSDNANTDDIDARIGFATATTPTGDGVVLTHPGIAPGSGFPMGDGSGIIGVGASNEDLRITTVASSGTPQFDVLVKYFTLPI